jgi:hypothetical protein
LFNTAYWFGLSNSQARVFWMLGRADDAATTFAQIVLQERNPTSAMRKILRRERKAIRAIERRRFLAVMEQIGEGFHLPEACERVARMDIGRKRASPVTIAKEYRLVARQLRASGQSGINLMQRGNLKWVEFPRSGRPPASQKR